MTAGIYAINHIPTGMKYIGSSKCVSKRFKDHKKLLNDESHHCKKLQHAWIEHGEKNFEFYQIEKITIIDKLLEREQFWIDFFDVENCGFNTMLIAGQQPWGPGGRRFHAKTRKAKLQEKEKIEAFKRRRKMELTDKENRAKRLIEAYIKKRESGSNGQIFTGGLGIKFE